MLFPIFITVLGQLQAFEASDTTIAAISRAEEIGSVDGVSGVFFGPADIAADMGMLGKPNDPAVWDAIMPAVPMHQSSLKVLMRCWLA